MSRAHITIIVDDPKDGVDLSEKFAQTATAITRALLGFTADGVQDIDLVASGSASWPGQLVITYNQPTWLIPLKRD